MKSDEIFICPICKSKLNFKYEDNKVICVSDKKHCFDFRNGVIDFSNIDNEVDPNQTKSKDSFGLEWSVFYPKLGLSDKEFDHEKQMFLRYTRSMPHFFADKIILDAGCGNGRYSNIVSKISKPDIFILSDISDSIYEAKNNLAHLKNAYFVKCDMNNINKFLNIEIDYAFSIGVLHHTPDAKKSFKSIAETVKKGGFLSCYVYGKGNPILHKVNIFLRNKFFKKFKPKSIMNICRVLSLPYYILRKIKLLGPWILELILKFIFIGNIHNMFDAYSAGYTSFHSDKELSEWYYESRFSEYVIEYRESNTALYCIGKK